LYEVYSGEKQYKLVDGTHNTERETWINDCIGMFFHNCLRVDDIVHEHNLDKKDTVDDNFFEGMANDLKIMQDEGYLDEGVINYLNFDGQADAKLKGLENKNLKQNPDKNHIKNEEYKNGLNNNQKFNDNF